MKVAIIFLSILFLNLTHNAQCVTGELLRNPSFESTSGCPVSVNGSLNSPNTPLMTVNDWLHGTGGSPDYYNCGQTLTSFGVPGYDAPIPYPNGTGYLGVLNYNAVSFGINVSEYCAQCLTTPLISGQTYTFTFKLAGNQNCNQPPVQIGIWGTSLCSAINYSGTECPTVGGYSLLGLSSTISPNTNLWYTGSIVFTAPSSIAAVVIGINCTYPNAACGFYNYYYFDDFSLKGSDTSPSPTASSGGVITCSTPNVTLTGGGGGTYSWSGPGIVGANNTQNISVNTGGIYNLIVTAANGCTATTNVVVTQNITPPSPTASAGGVITCSSPNVTLTGVGGVTYNWSGPSIVSGGSTSSPVVNAGGTYNLTVTGANGCTANTSVSVTQNTTLPTVSTSPTTTNLNCSTLSTSLNGAASGGTSPYSYSWSPATGLSATNVANPTANPSSSQTYVLTIIDNNGCQNTSSVNINVNNTPPTPSATGGILNCSNTSINLNSGGGVSYSWSGPGIVSGGNTSSPTVNQLGTYNVTVTGSNGCTANTSTSVSQNTTSPTATITGANTLSTTCANPTTTLSASSSSDPNTIYQWLAPNSSTLTGNPVTTSAVGVYTLVITDTNNGCSSSPIASSNNTVQIVPDSNIPTATLSTSNVQITCSNLTPSVVVSTSNTNITFNWTPTTGIVSGITTNNPTFGASGSYSLVVTNTLNGCATGTGDYVVIVTTNTNAPVISLSSVANTGTITCGSPNVLITPTITPSTGLTYTWSPSAGLSTNPNQADATIIAAGVYTLSVTNTLTGCMSVMNTNNTFTVISSNNVPIATITAISTNSTINCGAGSFVTYSATVQSTNPINYNWLPNGATTSTININSAGVYTLIVTDAITNCSVAVQYTVSGGSTIPNISANASATLLCSSGTITLNATSTNTNVSYVWQGPTPTSITSGNTTNNPVVNAIGIYTVTITDLGSNCFNTATVSVIQESITASFSASPDNGIAPLPVDFINQSIGAVSYNWFFGDGNLDSNVNPNHVYTNAGTYTITLIAYNGTCLSNSTFIIIVNENVTIIIPNLFTPNADGKNELFFITNIDKYPNNKLEIYNRWGSLVFLKQGYNNTFDGISNQPSMGNGVLPSGTYFFSLDLGDGKTKPYNGYLELQY